MIGKREAHVPAKRDDEHSIGRRKIQLTMNDSAGICLNLPEDFTVSVRKMMA